MRNPYARSARGVLLGTIKWVPVLAIPFSAFFAETWLQLQIFRRDYEAAELSRQIKETGSRIEALEEQADELMTLERIAAQAPDLGLVQPEPSQIEIVRLGNEEPLQSFIVPYEMAQLPAAQNAAPSVATEPGGR
ncbi:MAG: hypothetical protein IT364_13945 [Candidatus Hydrogenedentes bacterium]|nr:hypothetical protein [Candidatus Hydrogenedentota bacterium]